MLLAMVDTG